MSPRFEPHELSAFAAEWQQQQVQLSRVQAEQARILSGVVELALAHESADTEVVLRSYAAELASISRVSDRTVLRQLHEAHQLVTEYPLVHAALSDGKIGAAHARTIVDEGIHLAQPQREAYSKRTLDVAFTTTAGRLRSRAARIAESLKPICIEERHQRAAAERKVWVRDLPDGMAELHAEIPAILAYGIYDRLTRAARATQKRSDAAAGTESRAKRVDQDVSAESVDLQDRRSIDELRADIFSELLLTSTPADLTAGAQSVLGIVPQVTVVVSAAAQKGATAPQPPTAHSGNEPAHLRGYGPIDPATARQFAAVAPNWSRVAIDTNIESDTYGTVLGTDRYKPTEAMRRILEERDQHCRFPGCRMPLNFCEIDHTIEWSRGGPTSTSNLAHLCKRHHMLKHPDLADDLRWQVTQQPGGTLIWKSPTGRHHADHPEHAGSPRFAEATDPPD